MWTKVKAFLKDERGLETVEYAVVTALLVAAAIGAFTLVGTNVATRMNNVAGTIAP